MYHSTLMEAMLMCVEASAYCSETLEERIQSVETIADVPDSELRSLLEGLIAPEFMARMEIDVAHEVLVLTTEDIQITEEYRASNQMFHGIKPLYESYRSMVWRRYAELRKQNFQLYLKTVNADPDIVFLHSLFRTCLDRNISINDKGRAISDRISYLVRNELFRTEKPLRHRRITDPTPAIRFWESELNRAQQQADSSTAQKEDAECRCHEQYEVHDVGQHFHLGMVGSSGPRKTIQRLNQQKARITDRNQARFSQMQRKRELYAKHLARVRYCEERLSVANGKLEALNNRAPICHKVAAKLKAGDRVWDVRTQKVHTIDQVVVEGDRLTIDCKEGTISGSLSDFR